MNEQYETDTHEMRQLQNFAIGDQIIINGNEYYVIGLIGRDLFVQLMYDDLRGTMGMLKEHKELLFRARKRVP